MVCLRNFMWNRMTDKILALEWFFLSASNWIIDKAKPKSLVIIQLLWASSPFFSQYGFALSTLWVHPPVLALTLHTLTFNVEICYCIERQGRKWRSKTWLLCLSLNICQQLMTEWTWFIHQLWWKQERATATSLAWPASWHCTRRSTPSP